MVKSIMLWLTRSILVGVAYVIGLMIVGVFLRALGVRFASANQGTEMMPWLFVGGIVIGLVLGPIASQLGATRMRQVIIWTCVIFFSIVSVVVEGAFFAPLQISDNLPALVAQQLTLTLLIAIVITLLFAPKSNAAIILPLRKWYDVKWTICKHTAHYFDRTAGDRETVKSSRVEEMQI